MTTAQRSRTGCRSRAWASICSAEDRLGGQEDTGSVANGSPADVGATVLNDIMQGSVLWHDLQMSML